jgi:hypothetical protein
MNPSMDCVADVNRAENCARMVANAVHSKYDMKLITDELGGTLQTETLGGILGVVMPWFYQR